MFILSSISRDLQFWSVNHTLLYKNSGSEVFGNTTFFCEISINWPNYLLGTHVSKTLQSRW